MVSEKLYFFNAIRLLPDFFQSITYSNLCWIIEVILMDFTSVFGQWRGDETRSGFIGQNGLLRKRFRDNKEDMFCLNFLFSLKCLVYLQHGKDDLHLFLVSTEDQIQKFRHTPQCAPLPLSAGGIETRTKFTEKGGLIGSQFLEGVAEIEGG